MGTHRQNKQKKNALEKNPAQEKEKCLIILDSFE